MLSPKKLVQMAKKWQKMSAIGRTPISLERKLSYRETNQSTSPRADKGHFVVYTIDGKRFMIPIDYLNTRIVIELFQISEEEFGYTADGPITLPCEAAFMEYAMDLVKRGVSEEVERALLNSLLLSCDHACSVQSNLGTISQQLELCCF